MAIAFDAFTDLGTGAVSPRTGSHTVTGSQAVLLVGIACSADNVTAVTYNGVAMTQLAKVFDAGTGELYIYGLVGPATGAHTVSVTFSAGTVWMVASSYTGVKQTGLPDAFTSGTQAAGPATYAHSITTVTNNAWAASLIANGSGTPATANANVTRRGTGGAYLAFGDSNAVVTPAGSFTQTWNVNAGGNSATVQAAIAPFGITGAMFGVF